MVTAKNRNVGNVAGDTQYQSITEEDWDNIFVEKPASKKESPYDEMLNLVSDGQIIAWPIPDDTKLKGIRIGIARRASQHFNLSVQFKYDASKKILAIRLAPEKPDQPRGRGRPPVKK